MTLGTLITCTGMTYLFLEWRYCKCVLRQGQWWPTLGFFASRHSKTDRTLLAFECQISYKWKVSWNHNIMNTVNIRTGQQELLLAMSCAFYTCKFLVHLCTYSIVYLYYYTSCSTSINWQNHTLLSFHKKCTDVPHFVTFPLGKFADPFQTENHTQSCSDRMTFVFQNPMCINNVTSVIMFLGLHQK